LKLHLNRGLKNKLWSSKISNPHFENFETFHLRIPKQNDIWVQGPWPGTNNIIRGKVVASPKSGRGESFESFEFIFAHGSSMHQKCSTYALTNLLFGLCKFV